MFRTHDAAKRKNFFAVVGENHWQHVGIVLNRAWFHVTYEVKDKESVIYAESLLIYNVEDLLEFNAIENFKIKFVDIVSPNYMNGTKRWKMEPLLEIWLCASDEEQNHQERVFLLENGSRYKDFAAASFECDFTEDRLIFSACG